MSYILLLVPLLQTAGWWVKSVLTTLSGCTFVQVCIRYQDDVLDACVIFF